MTEPVFAFESQLGVGQEGERVAVRYLSSLGFLVKPVAHMEKASTSPVWGHYDSPDLLVTGHVSGTPTALLNASIEVKTEPRAAETGNVALELISNIGTGRQGWCYSTKASHLFHYSPGDGLVMIVPMEAFRERLREAWHRMGRSWLARNPHFTATGILVPREELGRIALHVGHVASNEDTE